MQRETELTAAWPTSCQACWQSALKLCGAFMRGVHPPVQSLLKDAPQPPRQRVRLPTSDGSNSAVCVQPASYLYKQANPPAVRIR